MTGGNYHRTLTRSTAARPWTSLSQFPHRVSITARFGTTVHTVHTSQTPYKMSTPAFKYVIDVIVETKVATPVHSHVDLEPVVIDTLDMLRPQCPGQPVGFRKKITLWLLGIAQESPGMEQGTSGSGGSAKRPSQTVESGFERMEG
jgi:hypothetical protein